MKAKKFLVGKKQELRRQEVGLTRGTRSPPGRPVGQRRRGAQAKDTRNPLEAARGAREMGRRKAMWIPLEAACAAAEAQVHGHADRRRGRCRAPAGGGAQHGRHRRHRGARNGQRGGAGKKGPGPGKARTGKR